MPTAWATRRLSHDLHPLHRPPDLLRPGLGHTIGHLRGNPPRLRHPGHLPLSPLAFRPCRRLGRPYRLARTCAAHHPPRSSRHSPTVRTCVYRNPTRSGSRSPAQSWYYLMPEPFLIAHLVRGEPAFDIATQIICPECSTINPATGRHAAPEGCDECDHTGYWWIIPTSGHRAYPYWYQLLGAFRDRVGRHADNWLTI